MEIEQSNKNFKVKLEYNSSSHLFTIPVILGTKNQSYEHPYNCAIDFQLPTILVPSIKCNECTGQKYQASTQPTKETNISYPHKQSYWNYTDDVFVVQEERSTMFLNFQKKLAQKDNKIFNPFEFYSIVKDQKYSLVHSYFGLGLISPPIHEDDGNILQWMQRLKYIDFKIASIYLGLYNGQNEALVQNAISKYDLPEPHIQFGQFDLVNVAKNEEIHFFTSSSQSNWTLDFFGMQYNNLFYDLNKNNNYSQGLWQLDDTQNDQSQLTNSTVYKAHLNPSSPFIVLPHNLFKLISAQWIDQSQDIICEQDYCMIFSQCSDVQGLSDFSLKLGSLNDTMKYQVDESEDQFETENILHRGPKETIYNEWRQLYFKLPLESYLIPGQKLGFEQNSCFLAFTGFVPDAARIIILGQPFFQSYYTVINQDNMKIGIAANQGSNSEISQVPFQDQKYIVIILVLFLFILIVLIAYFAIKTIKKRHCKKQQQGMDDSLELQDDLVSLKSKNQKQSFKFSNLFRKKNALKNIQTDNIIFIDKEKEEYEEIKDEQDQIRINQL